MKKKFTALCSIVVVLSVCFAVFTVNIDTENNVTTATAKAFYAGNEENAESTQSTTSSLGSIVGDVMGEIGSGSSGGLGDLLGGIGSSGNTGSGSSGGIGDALGGIGDALGGIGNGLGDVLGGVLGGSSQNTTTAPVITTSADIGLIIPVPAATQATSEKIETSATAESQATGETVDFAATSNPYTKPTSTFVAGDEDETIKWLQWIFIYTGYGLNDNGITGVLDEDTVAVVKKLQHENKMTVDGNITEEVIKAAEVLYYQSMLGDDVSAIEVSSEATTGVNASNAVNSVETGNNRSTVILLIVILVIIWVLAIGGIILLFVFKKKKTNAIKQAEAEKKDSQEKNSGNTEISSLSDLFEEAEKKNK